MISKSVEKMRELELEGEIDDEDLDDFSDSDACDTSEIDRCFTRTENVAEIQVSAEEYVLHISATKETNPSVAVGLSKNTCDVYKLSDNHLAKTYSMNDPKQSPIIDCKFSTVDDNFLYTGSTDEIKLWDIRTPKKPSVSFRDTTELIGEPKTLTCFDVSSNNRLLSAGTNVCGGDAFILFWDIRNANLLGGYWESHTDDVTQVRFHPDDMNKMISGSVDGLINTYDLTQTCEDDALIDTLNTESSIEKLSWYTENGKEGISCITHTADLQLWYVDGAEPYKHIERNEMAKVIKKKHDDFIYVANCHQGKNSQIVLVGTNYKDGRCLRAVEVRKNNVSPFCGFQENSQRIRCSWFNENVNILLTGGEKGLLNVWKLQKNT